MNIWGKILTLKINFKKPRLAWIETVKFSKNQIHQQSLSGEFLESMKMTE